MKLKFVTPRQATKDQHRLKEKIEKERIENEEIQTVEGREIEEKEKEVKVKKMEKEVEKYGVSSKATYVQLHSFTKGTTVL